jgi:hypothetical protein
MAQAPQAPNNLHLDALDDIWAGVKSAPEPDGTEWLLSPADLLAVAR